MIEKVYKPNKNQNVDFYYSGCFFESRKASVIILFVTYETFSCEFSSKILTIQLKILHAKFQNHRVKGQKSGN